MPGSSMQGAALMVSIYCERKFSSNGQEIGLQAGVVAWAPRRDAGTKTSGDSAGNQLILTAWGFRISGLIVAFKMRMSYLYCQHSVDLALYACRSKVLLTSSSFRVTRSRRPAGALCSTVPTPATSLH